MSSCNHRRRFTKASTLSSRPGYPGLAQLLTTICLVVPALCAADEKATAEREIKSVKSRIETVQTRIRSAQNEIEEMLIELRRYETSAAEVNAALGLIDSDIDAGQERLALLNGELDQLGEDLRREKELLSEQVRAMHRTGRNDYLKLLLNQEDPARFGRTLAYHNYYTRARTDRIATIGHSQERIRALREIVRVETEGMVSLRAGKEAKLAELTEQRKGRQQLLARSRRFIEDQDRQLQVLLNTERELKTLINRLSRSEDIFEWEAPFASLKGKLQWPVHGKIITRYGELKKGGKLKSRGITFASAAGTEVHAISSGTVVYADWFRNLGLLLILDHGDGYMSLYGHNEVLLRQTGDRVGRNNPIARTGDTGGQQLPGLYFEIRRGGDPLNPSLWCRS